MIHLLYNLFGDSYYHNALLIDVGFIEGTNCTIKYTMECGNDSLVGKCSTTAEPTPLILLAIGLVLLIILNKYNKSRYITYHF